MAEYTETVRFAGRGFEVLGVLVLAIGTFWALVSKIRSFLRSRDRQAAYRGLRQGVGRSILAGLEILVAADIIRSVAIAPSFQSVGVLALIVLVRTFLSWALEVEINGRWPWQRPASGEGPEESEV